MFEGIKVVVYDNFLKLLHPKPMGILIALLLLAVVLVFISRSKGFNTRTLAYGAIAITTSFLLSAIPIIELPNGGSITLAGMLPLIIFAYIAGPRAGVLAGLCFGLIHFAVEPYFVHWAQFLLDYPLAFAMLGFAGLYKNNIYLGAGLGCFGRLICHFLSGVIFFASYAGNQNVFLYSFLYNLSYLLPDIVICIGILLIPTVTNAIKRVKTAF